MPIRYLASCLLHIYLRDDLHVVLYCASSRNHQSVLVCADWQVWNSMDNGSGPGATQFGAGTSTLS